MYNAPRRLLSSQNPIKQIRDLSEWNRDAGGKKNWGNVSPEVKVQSEVLKMYLDVMYGVSLNLLDFSTSLAPDRTTNVAMSVDQEKRSHRIDLSVVSDAGIDKGSALFLSSSNIAHMSVQTQYTFPNQTSYFDTNNFELDPGRKGEFYPQTTEHNRIYQFMNRFGSIPKPDYLTAPIDGMIFEDVFCIDFSHLEWEESEESSHFRTGEEEVPSGLATSEGFDFGQYRVTISLVPADTDTSAYDRYGL